MNRAMEPIRRKSIFLVAAILILLVGYIVLLHYLRNILPLPIFVESKRVYVNILAIGFLALLPVLAISNYLTIIRVVLLVLITPFSCLFSYISTDHLEQLLDSAELDNHRYHITVQGLLEPRVMYSTYKCNINDLACEKIYTDIYNSIESVSLQVDEKADELYVLRRDDILFIDGAQPREILTSEQYEDFIYYMGVYPPYGSSISSTEQNTYMLYECKGSFMSCRQLPFHYTDTGGSFKLTFDERTKDVKIFQWKYNSEDMLIYSYGNEPKCYVERCSIPDV